MPTRSSARSLTLGGSLAVVLLLAAAAMRFYALGRPPLSADEAAQALAALRFVGGQPQDLTPYSPLLTHANLLLFFLFGGSDGVARIVPALTGVLLAVLPFVLLRQRLGTGAALAAGLLIALSPTFLLFSRSVDPVVITAACALVLVVELFAYLEDHAPRRLVWIAAALALGLNAGPGIYTVLFLLFLYAAGSWVLHRLGDERTAWPLFLEAMREAVRRRRALAQAGAVFAAVFVAVATGFLVNFAGVQAALNLVPRWIAAFRTSPDYPLWYHLGGLLLYEPVSLLFGLLGAVAVLRRGDRLGGFLVFWFVGGLALYTVLGVTDPRSMPIVLLPLALLAGVGVAQVLHFGDRTIALQAAIVAAFVTPMLVYAGLQVSIYAVSTSQPARLWMALGAAVLAMAAVILFVLTGMGSEWERTAILQGLGISLLVLALGTSVHMAAWLNYRAVNPARELLLRVPTSPNVRWMVQVLETISEERVGDTVSLPIAVDGRLGPVVPWYLKHFTNVTVIDEIRGPTGTPVVVVPAEEEQPPIGTEYVGQRFRLATDWRPVGISGVDFIRWYLWREGPTVPTRDVILYVSR